MWSGVCMSVVALPSSVGPAWSGHACRSPRDPTVPFCDDHLSALTTARLRGQLSHHGESGNMMTGIRVVPAAASVLALALVLTGCNDSAPAKSASSSTPDGAENKTSYHLGESSPPQESMVTTSADSTYTVTPTKVRMGTATDVENSGLDTAELPGPRVPVYVWSTLTHKSGRTAMKVDEMDNDLVIRTDRGDRTKALFVLMGDATWPDCPTPDSEKKLSAGESAEICTAFLITRGERAAAVELTQGFSGEPLEWPVKG